MKSLLREGREGGEKTVEQENDRLAKKDVDWAGDRK